MRAGFSPLADTFFEAPKRAPLAAMSNEEAIAVVVRVRAQEGSTKCLSVRPEGQVVLHGAADKAFTFDSVFDQGASQQELFDAVGKPLCDHALAGYNTTIFAYGQTGAGKTFTMHGPDGADEASRGLVPRAIDHLFKLMAREERCSGTSYQVNASYLEIYNEHVTDLLVEPPPPTARGLDLVPPPGLRVREDTRTGTYVENLTEEPLRSCDDALRLLAAGSANRSVGATAMNRESSRSHSVFTLSLRSSAVL